MIAKIEVLNADSNQFDCFDVKGCSVHFLGVKDGTPVSVSLTNREEEGDEKRRERLFNAIFELEKALLDFQ